MKMPEHKSQLNKPLRPAGTELEKRLSSIFQDESGKIPDLTKLEARRSHRLLFAAGAIGAFILLLVGAAWVGFLVFQPYSGYKGQGLKITLDGPERVVLGEEMTYFVNWQNLASEPLASADIRVSFPADFSPTSIDPKPNGEDMAWKLGAIDFGGRGTIAVKGIFTGALGTKTAIQIVGNYRPASFSSEFEALATRQIEYADTVIDGKLVLPEKVLPGDKIRIAYAVTNRGDAVMKGLEARVALPEGFVRDAATGTAQIDEREVRIPVGDLGPGASTTVAVTGAFASGHAGESSVHAELGRIGVGGSFQPAQRADAAFEVLSGDLTLKLVANGSDADRSVSFGETLRVSVGYENTATEHITDVMIRIRFEPLAASSTADAWKKPSFIPPFLDWTRAEISSSGTASGDAITWNMPRLPPNQDGALDVSIPLLASVSGTSGFQVIAEATMKKVGGTVVNRSMKSSPIVFRFRTDADLASGARYYSEEGAPLGEGPLPPVVGQTTRYRVEWVLAKTIHELKSVRVSATLPKRVAWPAKSTVDAGDFAYDETTRTVSWTLNRMPADVSELHADFDLDLTPSDFDAGRFADLLGETRLEMTDADINEPITRVKPALTTDLQNDDGAKSKGVVRKP